MMNDENCVIFKGTKDGLVVLLSPDIDFATLKKYLRKKTEDAKKFFQGAKVSLMFKGRVLNEEEQYELLQIISEQTQLNISFIHDDDSINNSDKLSNKSIEDLVTYSLSNNIEIDKTQYYKGTIRSGQKIEFEGSVVVIGDVNPGGEIIAGGNIIILGSLKGTVHAGSRGSTKAFVAALNMRPMQLHIGNVITRSPDQGDFRDNSQILPQIAYMYNNNIYIEPIDYKILENL
ncbi:MAG: septum site-determining protein MinC [Epulopiscium sp.]|jgi:septum site-determining protein MinC|uniref:Probable septum site-determining protein MinC n=2 Tax=Defluviitalea raffinosedens TaxID=1450156 RepID=A0A7C8LRU2_9FIRM|nr:septum site-determining protein MinC [Defluviitalea raffinosedens]MDK2788535.1 septum site-determining protein MinC [Candidatus Epulonipiscium sp.]